MKDLATEQLTNLRRVAEAATPGKRTIQNRQDICDEYESFLMPLNWHMADVNKDADVEYELAIDPETVLSLLDTIEQQAAEIATWKDASQCDHPSSCKLGPLCPYCEIGRKNSEIAKLRKALRNTVGEMCHYITQGCNTVCDVHGYIGECPHETARLLLLEDDE
ncbi:MAG: ead/Ea22-like family protein [Gemmataceae bacterium]